MKTVEQLCYKRHLAVQPGYSSEIRPHFEWNTSPGAKHLPLFFVFFSFCSLATEDFFFSLFFCKKILRFKERQIAVASQCRIFLYIWMIWSEFTSVSFKLAVLIIVNGQGTLFLLGATQTKDQLCHFLGLRGISAVYFFAMKALGFFCLFVLSIFLYFCYKHLNLMYKLHQW